MISVLIPVYNYKIFNLVKAVHSQLSSMNLEFEIVLLDDASTKFSEENTKVNQFKNTFYFNLDKNVGRAKIRNLLVEKANYNWLLFLDADVIPQDSNFIKKYVNCIKNESYKIYCGGIVYENINPKKNKSLRWFYGKTREEIKSKIRNKNPYQYFLGANFLIRKSVFDSVKFNENIVKYGYEDVLFVEDLRRSLIKVNQIENAVFHLGIEENSEFLDKTKEALINLKLLSCQNIVDGKHIKILRAYNKIKLFRMNKLFSILYLTFRKFFEYNLKSEKPSIFIFDLYKLTYFCFIN